MTERLVVIGGDAAGMSAASQAKRLRGDKLEVIAFERGAHSSYSACGIPYWVAGDVRDEEDLVARSPEEHRRNGIDLRMLTDVEAIDVQAGPGAVGGRAAGRRYREGFVGLVGATGAVPARAGFENATAAMANRSAAGRPRRRTTAPDIRPARAASSKSFLEPRN